MDGGAGDFDSVEYSNRRADVRVDLGSGTAGAGGEHDTVANVESAFTGRGDDVLIGDDAGNELSAGTGRDRVDGRGGDDQMSTIGVAPAIRCGAGIDSARPFKVQTVVEADCESVSGVDLVPARAQPVLRGGAAIVEVRVPERRRGKLLSVTARLRDADGAFTNRWTIRLR